MSMDCSAQDDHCRRARDAFSGGFCGLVSLLELQVLVFAFGYYRGLLSQAGMPEEFA